MILESLLKSDSRERERERERERGGGERERDRDRQTDRQTEADRQRRSRDVTGSAKNKMIPGDKKMKNNTRCVIISRLQ